MLFESIFVFTCVWYDELMLTWQTTSDDSCGSERQSPWRSRTISSTCKRCQVDSCWFRLFNQTTESNLTASWIAGWKSRFELQDAQPTFDHTNTYAHAHIILGITRSERLSLPSSANGRRAAPSVPVWENIADDWSWLINQLLSSLWT